MIDVVGIVDVVAVNVYCGVFVVSVLLPMMVARIAAVATVLL